MTQELVARQTEIGIIIPPEVTLENARIAAKALADVISKKKKPVIMNGEQYLEFEDWQTCGQFYGYTVKTSNAVPVEINGVTGAKAQADLIDIKTGMYLGGAEAYCMRDEEHWNTRPKYEWQGEGDNRKRVKIGDEIVPWFQLASMAQTRAGAKAFRNRLAWVVMLAGYRPTPAEEMTESTVSEAVQERRTGDKTSHYCLIHNVNFFKKGRMKGYAHPIEGTDEWCNEEIIKQPTESEPLPVPDAPESITSPTEEGKSDIIPPLSSNIDLVWLAKQLNILNEKLPAVWGDSNLLSFMRVTYNVEAESPVKAASLLDKNKAAHFIKKIEEALKKIS